jgi:hypothetical protein
MSVVGSVVWWCFCCELFIFTVFHRPVVLSTVQTD